MWVEGIGCGMGCGTRGIGPSHAPPHHQFGAYRNRGACTHTPAIPSPFSHTLYTTFTHLEALTSHPPHTHTHTQDRQGPRAAPGPVHDHARHHAAARPAGQPGCGRVCGAAVAAAGAAGAGEVGGLVGGGGGACGGGGWGLQIPAKLNQNQRKRAEHRQRR